MKYLLVTNDFPPKVGGIQNYLWELWRRLPSDHTAVYCTPYEGDASFDAQQPFAIERSPEPVLIPYPWLGQRIRRIARQTESSFVVLDPALPLGHIGPSLGINYAVVLHGAEVTIPGRLPVTKTLLQRTLRSASLVISAGEYALLEAERCAGVPLRSVVIPPGVDTERFRPGSEAEKKNIRDRFEVRDHDVLVSAVSRLVPRKGFDTLVRALARVSDDLKKRPVKAEPATISADLLSTATASATRPRVVGVVGGAGREHGRLKALAAQLGAPITFPGRLDDSEVGQLYAASDLMAMPCTSRWFGLEQEGFGIAFLEAAAVGIPQLAGRSGGSHEAVEDGQTGVVLDDPEDHAQLAAEILRLVDNPELRAKMGTKARIRAQKAFNYDVLADHLHTSIMKVIDDTGT